ncbi:hypothetical protein D3C81_1839210 [compost metagenome]
MGRDRRLEIYAGRNEFCRAAFDGCSEHQLEMCRAVINAGPWSKHCSKGVIGSAVESGTGGDIYVLRFS